MGKPREISNAEQVKHVALMKEIKVEQNFANQAYANFKSVKFGIDSCCYTDFQKSQNRPPLLKTRSQNSSTPSKTR